MHTETKLKKYIQYQKNLKRPRIFNIYAFLLNSLFYLFIPIWSWFGIYLIGSIVLGGIVYLTTNNFAATVCVLLILRLINAFTADKVVLTHIQKFIDHNQDVNYSRPIIFFPIMARRFFIYNVLSCGLYQFFWMFKNWGAVKKDTKDTQIHPFWQSWILGIFFIYPLINIILVSLKKNKICRKHFSQIAYSYIFCLFAMVGIFWCLVLFKLPLIAYYICAFFYFSFNICGSLLLAMVQKRINFYNRKKNPQLIMELGYKDGGGLVISIGFVILSVLLCLYYIPPKDNTKLMEAVTNVYQMTEGYPHFCQTQGYQMKHFPQVYQNYFRKEISIIKSHLRTEDMSLETAFLNIPQESLNRTDEMIIKNMTELKPMIIEMIISRKHHFLPTDDFDIGVAREFLEQEITFPVLCSEIDNNAYSLINKNKKYQISFRNLLEEIQKFQ